MKEKHTQITQKRKKNENKNQLKQIYVTKLKRNDAVINWWKIIKKKESKENENKWTFVFARGPYSNLARQLIYFLQNKKKTKQNNKKTSITNPYIDINPHERIDTAHCTDSYSQLVVTHTFRLRHVTWTTKPSQSSNELKLLLAQKVRVLICCWIRSILYNKFLKSDIWSKARYLRIYISIWWWQFFLDCMYKCISPLSQTPFCSSDQQVIRMKHF